MRVRLAAVGVALGLASALASAAPQQAAPPSAFDKALRAAMAPYYAALLSSAQDDVERTQRHMFLLRARWQEAARLGRTGAAPALVADPSWANALDSVTGALDRTRQRLAKHDAPGAHAELESIRVILHDARARHRIATFDDRLSEFHEAMEHLTSRVPEAHEFRLTQADLAAIRQDLDQVRHHWQAVQAAAADVSATPGWADTAPQLDAAIRDASTALEQRDTDAIRRASDAIRTGYLDLLAVLATARP